jgi:hypothetical protein
MPSPVTDVCFVPLERETGTALLVLLADNSLQSFDVMARNLTAPLPGQVVPDRVRRLPASLTGISIDPTRASRVVLYSHAYAVLVDMMVESNATRLAAADGGTASPPSTLRKRSRTDRQGLSTPLSQSSLSSTTLIPANYIVFNVYRNLIHLGCLKDDKLVTMSTINTVSSFTFIKSSMNLAGCRKSLDSADEAAS